MVEEQLCVPPILIRANSVLEIMMITSCESDSLFIFVAVYVCICRLYHHLEVDKGT